MLIWNCIVNHFHTILFGSVWLYFHIPLDSACRMNQNTIKSFYSHVMVHMLPNVSPEMEDHQD